MSIKRIIIPARAGSKGWPGKNVKLFDYTINNIPSKYRKLVTVSTDDDKIEALSMESSVDVYRRPEELSNDTCDIKSTLADTVSTLNTNKDDIIIVLYLTYPDRQWSDVESMYNTFVSNSYKSMLCRQPVATHPCLVMYDEEDYKGKLVLEHNYYQRQQYPKCFEISHYICMFRVGELPRLGKNMYNKNTRYYSIDRCFDIDNEADFNLFKKTI